MREVIALRPTASSAPSAPAGRDGRSRRRWWTAWWRGGLRPLVVIGLPLVLLLTACTTLATPRPTAEPSVDGEASDLSQPTGSAESVSSTSQVPVYWLGNTDQGQYLFREYRVLPAKDDSVSTAVTAMTSARPLDPDYWTPWRPASRVGSAIGDDNSVTVDISSDAFGAQLNADQADLAVQQLIFTATAAAANAGLIPADQPSRVVVLVDGHTGYRAFGQVTLGEPMTRQLDRAAPIWIIDPQDGTVVTGSTARATGRTTADVETVSWEIGRATTEGQGGYRRYRSGTVPLTPDSSGGGTFSLEQALPPGDYRLTVTGRSQDGSRRWADSKTVTMR